MNHFILLAFAIIPILADPQPTGGAPCENYNDCGGLGAGMCMFNQTQNGTGYCVCALTRGNPDCSYIRISRSLTGGLQFSCFIGVGGVGNFILGRTGIAIGQLILMASELIIVLGCCILFVPCFICIACLAIVSGGAGDAETKDIENATPTKKKKYSTTCCSCLVFAGWLWCIIDGARILEGHINDGMGYKTAP
jgi:hypothetical protein